MSASKKESSITQGNKRFTAMSTIRAYKPTTGWRFTQINIWILNFPGLDNEAGVL